MQLITSKTGRSSSEQFSVLNRLAEFFVAKCEMQRCKVYSSLKTCVLQFPASADSSLANAVTKAKRLHFYQFRTEWDFETKSCCYGYGDD